MPLKDVTVSSILDGGKNQKLWKKIRDKFVSKIQKQHKLSDDKVEKLEKMLMDKKVLKQGIADFKEIHKDTQIGGAKKKSRRRKKKKYAKKTKRRYRRGGNGDLPPSFLIGGSCHRWVVPVRTSTTRPGGPIKSLLANAACEIAESRIAIHELAYLILLCSEKIYAARR